VTPPLILAEREQPFWGFAEILLVVALFVPAVFAGGLAVRSGSSYFHLDPELGLPLLIAEFIGYAIIFLVLRILFARHGQPLLKSLAWVPQPFGVLRLVLIGIALSMLVVIMGNLLQFPDVQTPFDKLLSDTVSRFAIALFGITLGPVIEELLFRGFLQPVLVDSMGVLPGIFVTSTLFGAMHLMQNAFIWQSGLLIAFVGFVLGVIRHVSGSTRASAITHIAYNSLPFFSLLLSGGVPTHK
jgi:membrane protease YdiL (CAAX protease family)